LKLAAFDKSIVLGATVGVLSVAYIPLLYLTNAIGVEKLVLVAGLIAAVGLLVFVRFSVRDSGEAFDRQAFIVLLMCLGFVIYSIIRYAVAVPYPPADNTLRSIVFINPMFIFIALFCRRYKSLIIKVVLAMSCVYVASAFYALAQADPIFYIDYVFPGIEMKGALYQNVARYLGLFVIASLYFFESGSRLNWPLLAAGAVSLTGMTMVGGRAPFIALVAVLVVHLLHSIRTRLNSGRSIKLLVALPILVVVVGVVAKFGFGDLIGSSKLMGRFAVLLEGGDASLRLFLFGSAIELFLTDVGTFFFGAGLDSFPASIGKSIPGWYPHNVVLQLLAEYGIVGCTLFFLPLAYVIWRRRLAPALSSEASGKDWVIVLIATYFFVIACFSGNLGSSWLWLFFAYLTLPSEMDAT